MSATLTPVRHAVVFDRLHLVPGVGVVDGINEEDWDFAQRESKNRRRAAAYRIESGRHHNRDAAFAWLRGIIPDLLPTEVEGWTDDDVLALAG